MPAGLMLPIVSTLQRAQNNDGLLVANADELTTYASGAEVNKQVCVNESHEVLPIIRR